VSFFGAIDRGIEPIPMTVSGGRCLPPVQKLVATIIFA